jgi:polyphosphate kinase 2 (PPK2 family)
VDLQKFDPTAKPFSSDKGKQYDKDSVNQLAEALDGLQNIFYADRRFKLLVILQGMDAAGKDGTLRAVFGRMSPLGVRTVGWKAPTETEKAHDYLWRIHQQMPGAGEIVLFNRSQYEDVLVPVVNGWLTPEQQTQRYAQINDFERMLSETGTVIVKFMLHISKDEQRERLQQRLDDPASTGSSTRTTSRCAPSGTTTSRPTASCWAPRTRPGRPGPSCPPTPRPTAI